MGRWMTSGATAVVGLVAVTVPAGCALTGPPAGPAPAHPTAGAVRTAGVSAAQRPSNETLTRRRVQQALADAPVLPGARTVPQAPVAALERPTQRTASPNAVRATRWWTAPGSVPAALAYVRAHPPRGFVANGRGSLLGAGDPVESVLFSGRPTATYAAPTVVVAVVRSGGGVAVRADAEAVWLPRRTPVEHLGSAFPIVDVTVDRGDRAPAVQRTLSGRRALALAAAVDGLPVSRPGMYACPVDHGYTDTLVFHGAGSDVVVDVDPEGCGFVGVSVGHRAQPSLRGGFTVHVAVVKALGLPPAYLR